MQFIEKKQVFTSKPWEDSELKERFDRFNRKIEALAAKYEITLKGYSKSLDGLEDLELVKINQIMAQRKISPDAVEISGLSKKSAEFKKYLFTIGELEENIRIKTKNDLISKLESKFNELKIEARSKGSAVSFREKVHKKVAEALVESDIKFSKDFINKIRDPGFTPLPDTNLGNINNSYKDLLLDKIKKSEDFKLELNRFSKIELATFEEKLNMAVKIKSVKRQNAIYYKEIFESVKNKYNLQQSLIETSFSSAKNSFDPGSPIEEVKMKIAQSEKKTDLLIRGAKKGLVIRGGAIGAFAFVSAIGLASGAYGVYEMAKGNLTKDSGKAKNLQLKNELINYLNFAVERSMKIQIQEKTSQHILHSGILKTVDVNN